MQLYLILGVAWALSVAGATWYGYDWGEESATNKARAAHATALEETINEWRAKAVFDGLASAQAERDRQANRVAGSERVAKVEESLNANPSSHECRLADDVTGLLRDAINRANGAETTPKPPVVPAPPPTRGRPTGHHSAELRTND